MGKLSLPNVKLDWSESDLSHKWFAELARIAGYSLADGDYAFYRNERRTNNSQGLARQDFTMFVNGNPLVHVELKKPKVDLSFETLNKAIFKQAHKYAFSHYVVRRDQLVTPMGILTNGLHAYVFDGSIPDPDQSLAYAVRLDLSVEANVKKLLNFISVEKARLNEGFFQNEVITTPVKKLNRGILTGADEFLARTLCGIYQKLLKCKLSEKDAFTATVTYFLAAILRDCGFIPTEELNNLEEKGDWIGLVDALETHLTSDLSALKIAKANFKRAFELYNETRWLPVRLDIFPPDALGKAYEQLLHHVKGEAAKVCYYTPREVIDDILKELAVDEKMTVLDPCTGSSAFLTSCVERVFPLGRDHDTAQVKKYIESKVVGVDKDWFATQVSKAALTAIYARYLPNEINFKAPAAQIYEKNFFDFVEFWANEGGKKFDRVVGNPPWGNHLDWVEEEYHERLKDMSGYADKTCVSIYVFEEATKILKTTGRIGMLLKHEVLDGGKHANFRTFLTTMKATIWDYGRRRLFPRNSAQTIVAIAEMSKQGQAIVVPKDESAKRETYSYDGFTVGSAFALSQGFQSGNNKVYEHLAGAFKNHVNVRPMVAAAQLKPFAYSKAKKYMFIDPNSPVDKEILKYCKKTKLTLKLKKSKGRSQKGEVTNTIEWFLNNRAELLRKNEKSIGWLWVFNSKAFFKAKKKIFMPLYLKPSDRANAVGIYDKRIISKTDTCVLIPKVDIEDSLFRFILGFLNSKIGYGVLFNSCKQSGGQTVAAFPEYVEPIRVPTATDDVIEVVSQIAEMCEKGDFSLVSHVDCIFEDLVTRNNVVNPKTLSLAKKALQKKIAS